MNIYMQSVTLVYLEFKYQMQGVSEQQCMVFLLGLQRYWLLLRKLVCKAFYYQRHINYTKAFFLQRLTLLAIFISTFLFSLTWQFNQFMMLMQALVLFILDSLDMLPAVKVSLVFFSHFRGPPFNVLMSQNEHKRCACFMIKLNLLASNVNMSCSIELEIYAAWFDHSCIHSAILSQLFSILRDGFMWQANAHSCCPLYS